MTAALRLPLDVPVQPVLTRRQQAAWDLVRSTPGGVTAEQVGRNWYVLSGRPIMAASQFAHGEGLSVLRSKALAPLVIRRKASGRYEPRAREHRVSLSSMAETTRELDDGSWEAMFR